jgi:hypothetical protein
MLGDKGGQRGTQGGGEDGEDREFGRAAQIEDERARPRRKFLEQVTMSRATHHASSGERERRLRFSVATRLLMREAATMMADDARLCLRGTTAPTSNELTDTDPWAPRRRAGRRRWRGRRRRHGRTAKAIWAAVCGARSSSSGAGAEGTARRETALCVRATGAMATSRPSWTTDSAPESRCRQTVTLVPA